MSVDEVTTAIHLLKQMRVYGQDVDSGSWKELQVDTSGRLKIAASIEAGDIEIGAVEVKDADSDTRTKISAAGSAGGNGIHAFVAEDESGNVQRILVSADGSAWADIRKLAGAVITTGAGAVAAGTQRITLASDDPGVVALQLIDDTVATVGDAAPSKAILQGRKYQATPTAHADGDITPAASDAYGHDEPAFYNRALGAAQIVDIAPTVYDSTPITLRSSAALSAAGALDASPTEVPTGGRAVSVLVCTYTAGTAGGGVRLRIDLCDTIGGSDKWTRMLAREAAVYVQGANVSVRAQYQYVDVYSTSTSAELFRVVVPLNGADKIRVAAAEIGVLGTPGTLLIEGKLSNHYVSDPIIGDSKAYTSATDSKRTQEVDPLNEKYVEEELVDTTNVAATTGYYPSSSGMSMGAFRDVTIHGVISGGVTATVEATNDDAASPDWSDVTLAGYDMISGSDGNANFVDTNFLLQYNNFNIRLFRVKVITADATNGVQLHVRRKAL